MVEGLLELVLQGLERADLVGEDLGGHLDLHLHLVEPLLAREHDLVVRQGSLHRQQRRLHLAGEDVHPADDEHVVGAAGDAPDAPDGAAAGAGLGDDRRHVPGPVADHGHGVLGEGGEHQLPLGAVGEHLARDRVHHLRVEVVLEDVQPGLGEALDAHARTDDLGEPVDVVGLHPGVGLDAPAHGLAPGLGPEDPGAQPGEVGPQLLGPLGEVQEVAGGAADGGHREVLEHHDLPLGVSAGDGDDGGAQRLRAVVGPQAAGEEAVAVGVLDHVAPVQAAGREGPHHHLGPDVQVTLGVGHHGGLAGGAGGGVQADDLLHGAGEEAEGVGVAQVGLEREGEARQVLQALQIRRCHLPLLAAGAEERDPLVGPAHDALEPLQLEAAQLLGRDVVGGADRVEPARGIRGRHVVPFRGGGPARRPVRPRRPPGSLAAGAPAGRPGWPPASAPRRWRGGWRARPAAPR